MPTPPQNSTQPPIDYNTLAQDELAKLAGYGSGYNTDIYGRLYDKLQATELGQTYRTQQKALQDIRDRIARQYFTERHMLPREQYEAEWRPYREKAYAADPGYQAIAKTYGDYGDFTDYLNTLKTTSDPDIRQFQAAHTYFKRFIEPNIDYHLGYGPVPVTNRLTPDGNPGVSPIDIPFGMQNPGQGMLTQDPRIAEQFARQGVVMPPDYLFAPDQNVGPNQMGMMALAPTMAYRG